MIAGYPWWSDFTHGSMLFRFSYVAFSLQLARELLRNKCRKLPENGTIYLAAALHIGRKPMTSVRKNSSMH